MVQASTETCVINSAMQIAMLFCRHCAFIPRQGLIEAPYFTKSFSNNFTLFNCNGLWVTP